MHTIKQKLETLRSYFVKDGFDIRFVGGCVRDFLHGVTPKDFDLCTDANPEEQIAIYQKNDVSYHETGLQHGTITVVIEREAFEITSLRVESNHDGRHATVQYTRDWFADLGRRDLTINAMSMDFDGTVIDPFGGKNDLENKHIRFVGSPEDRMQEDYLRILRWLRFHGRFAANQPLDAETVEAAIANAKGLRGISRERVWMEISKIVSGEGAVGLIDSMYDMGIAAHIDLPISDRLNDLKMARMTTRNPVCLIYALLGAEHMEKIAADWKWSAEERDFGIFLSKCEKENPFFAEHPNWPIWMVAVDGHPQKWVAETVRMIAGKSAGDQFEQSVVPIFPVAGRDLLAQGMQPGKEVGESLRAKKMKWAESGFKLTKEELLK